MTTQQVLDLLVLLAMACLAVATVYAQRRRALRSGNKPRTGLMVACIVLAVLVVVGGATVVLAASR